VQYMYLHNELHASGVKIEPEALMLMSQTAASAARRYNRRYTAERALEVTGKFAGKLDPEAAARGRDVAILLDEVIGLLLAQATEPLLAGLRVVAVRAGEVVLEAGRVVVRFLQKGAAVIIRVAGRIIEVAAPVLQALQRELAAVLRGLGMLVNLTDEAIVELLGPERVLAAVTKEGAEAAVQGRRFSIGRVADTLEEWAAKMEGKPSGRAPKPTPPETPAAAPRNVPIPQGEVGTYTTKIKWGIQEVEARPAGPGYWGKRTPQTNPGVDAYELKINPNNESYYLPHPDGGYVQFENVVGTTLQDGKLVQTARSFYKPSTLAGKMRPVAEGKVLAEAQRQLEAATAQGMQVEWLVSDKAAAAELEMLFKTKGVNIKVTHLPE